MAEKLFAVPPKPLIAKIFRLILKKELAGFFVFNKWEGIFLPYCYHTVFKTMPLLFVIIYPIITHIEEVFCMKMKEKSGKLLGLGVAVLLLAAMMIGGCK